jgi:L-threonylcarbamoyladenylate synthase
VRLVWIPDSIPWGLGGAVPRALVLEVDPQRPAERVLEAAIAAIRESGIIAFPTETFYGLAVDAWSLEACGRVFELKGRPKDKALPCIVSGIPQLLEVAAVLEPQALSLARRFWPGPLTLVVAARPGLAAASSDGSIAVRASSLVLARTLAAALGGPVTATSANRADSPPPTTAAEVLAELGQGLDLILDGGPSPGGLPSTMVDVRTMPPRLVRPGRISFEDVLEASRAGSDPSSP